MTTRLSRRAAIAGALAAPVLGSLARAQDDRLAALERRHGGRLGVAALNLATGKRIGHRVDERFLMCSTFKALLAGFVLARVDRKEDKLDRRIVFERKDLSPYSPITETRVGGAGMMLAELCQATVILSDNGAANILLRNLGGPAAVTAWLRATGDTVTRLDRMEPELNAHDGPGDARDTTTPTAMLETLRRLLFAETLSRPSRHQLAAWLIENKTGDKRLRAGFGSDWTVGDKTGTSSDKVGNSHDVGVAWSATRGAVIVTAYCDMPGASGDARNAVIAEVGRLAAEL
jgi:beta-lactamase class A